MSAATVAVMPVRRAQSRDVKGSNLSRWAVIVYKDLVTHINADNVCWPKRETQANDLLISTRTVTKARNELLEKGWICYPEGNSGGRDFAKEQHAEFRGRGVRIHLHPDGCPCGLPKVESKQRTTARSSNGKRSPERAVQEVDKVEICSPLNAIDKVEFSAVKSEAIPVKSEIRDRAYKEGTISNGTFSTTTQPIAETASSERMFAVPSLPEEAKSLEDPSAEAVENSPAYLKKDFPEGKTVAGAEKLSGGSELAEALRKPEIVAGFEQLQRLVEDPIQDYGKRAILRAAREHGFTLEELGSAFRTAGQGFKRAGGLIKFATEIFPQHRQNGHTARPVRPYGRDQVASSFRTDPVYQAQAGTFEAETVSPERLQELEEEAEHSPSPICRQLALQRLRELRAAL